MKYGKLKDSDARFNYFDSNKSVNDCIRLKYSCLDKAPNSCEVEGEKLWLVLMILYLKNMGSDIHYTNIEGKILMCQFPTNIMGNLLYILITMLFMHALK